MRIIRSVAARLAVPTLGCAIAAAQLCIVLSLPFVSAQGVKTPLGAYSRLHQWDSGLYSEIFQNGYQSSLPRGSLEGFSSEEMTNGTNVQMYPGYPFAARIVGRIAGLRTKYALILTAQIANALFWIYVLLFLKRWRVLTGLKIASIAAIALHPSAFFLVSAYSESLFLASILGFLYWSSIPKIASKEPGTSGSEGIRAVSSTLLAAAHGFVMSATRIAGLPLAVAPLLSALPIRWNRAWCRSLLRPAAIALCAGAGGMLFFAYCAYAFGHWNLYMLRQQAGWGIVPDYGFFLHWTSGLYVPETFEELYLSDRWSQFATILTFWFLMGACLFQWRDSNADRRKTRNERWPFFWCAGWIFYISAAGLSGAGMRSMIRYTFPVYVLIILALVQGMNALRSSPFRRPVFWPLLAAIFCLLAYLQYIQILRFTNGEWVA